MRARWAGDARPGFAWLSSEIAAAWGVPLSRPALHKAAGLQCWAKGGDPSEPLRSALLPEKVTPEVTQKVTPRTVPKVTPAARKVTPRTRPAPPAPGTSEPVTDIDADGRPTGPQAGTEPAGADRPWIVKPQPLGRPSKYRLEYAAELVRYFTREPFDNIVIDADTGKTAQVPGKFPVLPEFAARIGVSSQTIYNWAKDIDSQGNRVHPEFFDALARARDLQYALLVQGALAGAYDSRFASLAAKNLIQWAEKVEMQVDSAMPDRATLEANYVTRMAAAYERQMAVLQRRGLLPDGASGGARD